MQAGFRVSNVRRRTLGICALVAAIVAGGTIAGCGSSVTATTVVTVTTPTSSPTIEQGQSVYVTATSSQAGGVTWSLPTGTIGSLSGATTTSVIYVAPLTVSASTTLSLSATAVADTTQVAVLSITVTPPISVTVSPNLATVAGLGTVNFGAGVLYDNNGQGVTWSLSGQGCAGSNCGTLTSVTTTSVTYNAPNIVPSPNVVTLTATSVADNTQKGTATITIEPPLPISVTITNKVSFAVANGPQITFNATVQNDPATTPKGVAWTLTNGGASCPVLCGSLTNMTSSSVTYVPPTLPTAQATVTATSLDDGTKSDSNSFPVLATPPSACAGTPTGQESQFNGNYAFLVQGFQGASGSSSAAAIAASIGANGLGGITGGDIDSNSATGYRHLTINTAGSSYTMGPADPTGTVPGNVGCMTLATSAGAVTFHFALSAPSAGVSSQGRITEFDDTTGSGTIASGVLRRQDTTSFSLAALSAANSRYAFGMDGVDSSGNPVTIGGLFSVSAAGAITPSAIDVNDNGAASGEVSGGSGTIAAISLSDGRATGSITTGSGTSYGWAIYMVNASEFFILETDPLASGLLTSGRALATANSFTQASLAGNYVFHYAGISNCNGIECATANLGLVTLSGGTFSSTVYSYNSYFYVAPPPPSPPIPITSQGTYAVDPTAGRTSLTLSNGSSVPGSPILYLVSPAVDGISAFVLGQDATGAFGLAEQQTSPSYSNASLVGNYFVGTEDPRDRTVTNAVGDISIISVNSQGSTIIDVTGIEDLSSLAGLDPGHIAGGTASTTTNGLGTIFSSSFVSVTSGSRIFYLNIGAQPAVITVLDRQ